jgi:hypothetical protein
MYATIKMDPESDHMPKRGKKMENRAILFLFPLGWKIKITPLGGEGMGKGDASVGFAVPS